MMSYLFLAIAIVSEVIATSALKASNGFTRLGPSLLLLVGYGSALYFLSLTLRTIPVGVAYAIWSGTGVSLITVIAWLVFRQRLDAAAIVLIAAQALAEDAVIVTPNTLHFDSMVRAGTWQEV